MGVFSQQRAEHKYDIIIIITNAPTANSFVINEFLVQNTLLEIMKVVIVKLFFVFQSKLKIHMFNKM